MSKSLIEFKHWQDPTLEGEEEVFQDTLKIQAANLSEAEFKELRAELNAEKTCYVIDSMTGDSIEATYWGQSYEKTQAEITRLEGAGWTWT